MDAKTYETLIEAPELAKRLGDPSLTIIDCRWDIARPDWGAAAYAESHIPGAVFASMDRDLADPIGPGTGRHPLPDARRFAETLGKWGVDDRTQVVAYDQNNAAAASRLWWLLRWLGHAKVAVLNGGFAAWIAEGLPITGEPASRASRVFSPRVRQSTVVSTSDVAGVVVARQANTTHVNGEPLQTRDNPASRSQSHDPRPLHVGPNAERGGALIVDARAADRFAGRNETIDPVAGHIPGALNHPFARNLDSNAKFLSAEELRQRWNETLGSRASQNVIAMCGSGVTACHNLLALEVAGLKGARLYAGSWSEWIKDPARPVEKES